MRYTFTVNCLGCGNPDLIARSDPDDEYASVSRSHCACPVCGKVYRLNLTLVQVRADRLVPG